MEETLKQLSLLALQLSDSDFSAEQYNTGWLGTKAASVAQINAAEKRLGVTLPGDYKTFLTITNGWTASAFTEPAFVAIEKIDYLKNIDSELISIWKETGNDATADQLSRSICITEKEEEQLFLLIPPIANENWQYWKFAHWIPGEEVYPDLKSYFQSTVAFISDELRSEEE